MDTAELEARAHENRSPTGPGASWLARMGRWLKAVVEVSVYALVAFVLHRRTETWRGAWTESLFRTRGSVRYLQETPGWILAFVIATFVFYPLVRHLRGRWSLREFGVSVRFEGGRACFVLMVAGLVVMNAGTLLIPGVTDAAWAAYGMASTQDAWVFVLWMSPVVAALAEEMFFRSALQGLLMEVSVPVGALSSAVLFAFMHGFQGLVPLLCFHLPSAILFAGVYAKRRDLVSQTLAHAVYDGIVFGEFWLMYRGGVDKVALTGVMLALSSVMLIAWRHDFLETVREASTLVKGLRRDWPLVLVAIPTVFYFLWLLRKTLV